MKIVFVRHAIAVERIEWFKDDLLRPLSDKGIITAKKLFKTLAQIYKKPDAIYASAAVRAYETASLLAKEYKISYEKDELLNPGCSFDKFKKFLKKADSLEFIVVVGHEPDISEITSRLISNFEVSIEVKKNAVVEIKIDSSYNGILKALLPPKVFI